MVYLVANHHSDCCLMRSTKYSHLSYFVPKVCIQKTKFSCNILPYARCIGTVFHQNGLPKYLCSCGPLYMFALLALSCVPLLSQRNFSAIKFEFITEMFFILDCKLPIDSIAVRNLWAIWCQPFFASSSCLSFLAPISPHASGYLLPVARQPHPYVQKML